MSDNTIVEAIARRSKPRQQRAPITGPESLWINRIWNQSERQKRKGSATYYVVVGLVQELVQSLVYQMLHPSQNWLLASFWCDNWVFWGLLYWTKNNSSNSALSKISIQNVLKNVDRSDEKDDHYYWNCIRNSILIYLLNTLFAVGMNEMIGYGRNVRIK